MATTPIPNMNPTGVIGSGSGNVMPGQNVTGFSAYGGTGGAGTMGFGNTMNPNPSQPPAQNPFQAGMARPMTSTSTGQPVGPSDPYSGYTTSEHSTTAAPNPYGQSQSQMNWTEKYLQETFGGGMGSLVFQYLMSGGGMNTPATQKVIDAQQQAMQGQIAQGANDLSSRLGAMGVSGSSSEMGSALSAYENQATAQENAIAAQEYYNMWNASQDREENMMQFAATGTGKTLANKANWMDYLNEGLGVAESVMTLGLTGNNLLHSNAQKGSGMGASAGLSSPGYSPGMGADVNYGDTMPLDPTIG